MEVTPQQLRRIAPSINNYYADHLSMHLTIHCDEYGVNNSNRMAAFLANAAHESSGFTRFSENLNYRAVRLQVVFPSKFPTPGVAAKYGGDPEAIANYVYGNRMGNGPESSGDGWKYRGRGIFQLTGKNNYRRCSAAIYGDESILLNDPHLVLNPQIAVISALWYWHTNGLNELADTRSFELITRKINGGLNGLEDRKAYFEKSLVVMG